jgi:C4-dicarboxylate-specific signal transduction histidine kinase
MASNLAHELNQPLMALSNFALAARTMVGVSSTEMLVSALDEIVGQAKRASEIINRVRGFINPNRRSYENVDAGSVIRQSLALMQPELQRSAVAVKLHEAENLPGVRGDHVLLEQVLVNLIQNAIQALQDLPSQRRVIDIATSRQENRICMTVADHGEGVPEDLVEQLFSPFFSTKSEGLGLGLSICRTIIEAHGGEISVKNIDSGGAIFSIHLPVAP